MLDDRVLKHVVESLREAYAERGWSRRELDSLERLIRSRAEDVNSLVERIQSWAQADEVDYDVLCTLLGHLPSVHLYFENPFMMQMRVPIGELLLTISDTVHENGELEGFEVVPNECPDLQKDADAPVEEVTTKSSDVDLSLFRKAFEDS
jgi:hypothetical protein